MADAPPPASALAGAPKGDRIFRAILTALAAAVPILLLLLVLQLWHGARPAIDRFGLGFLVDSTWDPVAEHFGALPLIAGTLLSSALALLIAVPLSLGVAIFLTEFAWQPIRGPVTFLIEMLAAIPSVVYGLWGAFVLIPFLRSTAFPFLKATL